MQHLISAKVGRLIVAAMAVLIVAAVGEVRILKVGASAPNDGVKLVTVSPGQLAAGGLNLDIPGSSASVSAQRAKDAVLAIFPGATVREEVLAQLHTAVRNQLVWVLSIIPREGLHFSGLGGRPGMPPPNYMLAFVDARTGSFLYAHLGM